MRRYDNQRVQRSLDSPTRDCMPVYEYRCKACGKTHEIAHGFNDKRPTECPSCGGELIRVFHPIGLVFKGSGFHKTDYGGASSRPSGESKSEGSSDSKSSDSKPSESKSSDKSSDSKSSESKSSDSKSSDSKPAEKKSGDSKPSGSSTSS
jgi:putative FmdB family regulatory protein